MAGIRGAFTQRLEKLEQAAQPESDALLIVIRFIVAPGIDGGLPNTVAARSTWVDGRYPSERIERHAEEQEEAFVERAERYFRRHQAKRVLP